MAELRLSEELLTRVLASSQATRREATTATTTPRTESTAQHPPVDPGEGEAAHDPAGHTAEGGDAQHGDQGHGGAGRLGVDPVHGDRGQEGAQVEADQNPPKDRTWTMAPSRRPWMAARATTTTTTRSTRFIAAGRRTGQESGTNGGQKDRHHRPNVDGRAGGRASSPLATWAGVARSVVDSIDPSEWSGRRASRAK